MDQTFIKQVLAELGVWVFITLVSCAISAYARYNSEKHRMKGDK